MFNDNQSVHRKYTLKQCDRKHELSNDYVYFKMSNETRIKIFVKRRPNLFSKRGQRKLKSYVSLKSKLILLKNIAKISASYQGV